MLVLVMIMMTPGPKGCQPMVQDNNGSGGVGDYVQEILFTIKTGERWCTIPRI